MSLKNVHLVFVTASLLLSLFVAQWALTEFRHGGAPAVLVASIVALMAAVAMGWYGLAFHRRCRRLGIA